MKSQTVEYDLNVEQDYLEKAIKELEIELAENENPNDLTRYICGPRRDIGGVLS